MIICSTEIVAKVKLSVDIFLRRTSWKLVEDMLTRLLFFESYVLKTSWGRLKDVLKISWTSLENAFARRLESVLKMNILVHEKYREEYICLDQEVLKTSSPRRMFAGWPLTSIKEFFLVFYYYKQEGVNNIYMSFKFSKWKNSKIIKHMLTLCRKTQAR